ncbi:hypothetical protein PMI02_01008 [Novosphingobium sp. AP12]|nr:hypothetical protein PMI02_01008 [Novosphingobium sp. AP12]
MVICDYDSCSTTASRQKGLPLRTGKAGRQSSSGLASPSLPAITALPESVGGSRETPRPFLRTQGRAWSRRRPERIILGCSRNSARAGLRARGVARMEMARSRDVRLGSGSWIEKGSGHPALQRPGRHLLECATGGRRDKVRACFACSCQLCWRCTCEGQRPIPVRNEKRCHASGAPAGQVRWERMPPRASRRLRRVARKSFGRALALVQEGLTGLSS